MMKAEELVLFPFGGNSREAALTVDAINASDRSAARWDLRGFIDDDPKISGRSFHSWPVLGGRSIIESGSFKGRLCAVPGHPDRFSEREKIINSLNWPSDRWATLIDPSAVVSPDARIGKNTVIMANVYIGPSAQIGDHCIVLPHSVVHHDSTVGDYSMIGSHVTVSGFCRIGKKCYVGSGAMMRQDIQIGEGSLLGLGAVVVKDVPSQVVVVGNPARILKEIR